MRNAQVVIKDNGNYSTGEWMQNPEKGCPKPSLNRKPFRPPHLLLTKAMTQYITEFTYYYSGGKNK